MKLLAAFLGITSALTVLAGAALAGSPTFDCDSRHAVKRLNDAEWTICRSGYLGNLDQDMAATYRQVKAQLGWRAGAKLRRTQRAWLSHRNACGDNRGCIARKYRQRTRQLARYEQCFDDSARPGCVWRKLSRDSRRWEKNRFGHLNGWRSWELRNLVGLWRRD